MTPVATIVISDPELLAKLTEAKGQLAFEGPTGDRVKTLETVAFGKLPPGENPLSPSKKLRKLAISQMAYF